MFLTMFEKIANMHRDHDVLDLSKTSAKNGIVKKWKTSHR